MSESTFVPSTGLRAIDLFAGWGGFTLGANAAGVDVVYAANHWPLAVQAHAHNHPKTIHECQDLRQADWSALPAYDILLASPACQGNSRAGRPSRSKSGHVRYKHDALRATAWAVVDCIEVTQPRAVLIENVGEIREWNKYDLWKQAIEREGYRITEAILNAADFGVPQLRERLFIACTRDETFDFDRVHRPTAGKPTAFGPCIEWEEGKWRPFSKARGAEARQRLKAASRLGRAVVQSVSLRTRAKAATGLSLDEPVRTITTQNQWSAVDGDRYRPFTLREYARAMGFPDGYEWPEKAGRNNTIMGLGNAVCPPVARSLVSSMAGMLGYPVAMEEAA